MSVRCMSSSRRLSRDPSDAGLKRQFPPPTGDLGVTVAVELAAPSRDVQEFVEQFAGGFFRKPWVIRIRRVGDAAFVE